MNPKLVLLGIGVAAVTSIAVPASLAKAKKDNNDDTITQTDGSLTEDREWEKTLDVRAKNIRKGLNPKQKLAFDQFHRAWSKHQNKKQVETYSNYFLDSKGNKDKWESKFDDVKKRRSFPDKIVYKFVSNSNETEVNITKAWDSNSEAAFDPNNTSLNIFCKHKKDSLSEEPLWELCSSFQEKPVTVLQGRKDESLISENQIGRAFELLLMATNDNASFWTKRQEEWKKLKSNNSVHFKYADNKQIKELCKEAYYKEIDATNIEFQKEVLKYCSLEWNS